MSITTRGPPPRVGARASAAERAPPSSLRGAVSVSSIGPYESVMWSVAQQSAQQVEVLEQVPRSKKALAHPFFSRPAHASRCLGVREHVGHVLAKGDKIKGVNETARDAVLDLIRDAAHAARDDRTSLPHGLRHGEAEALGQALLHDDMRVALQRVHHDRVLLDIV